MKPIVSVVLFVTAITLSATTGFAQSSSPTDGRAIAWISLGFQSDLGGAVNSSGVGVVNGLRAEIDANTWGERYDAALVVNFGGAYNLTSNSQLFGALMWEQAETDTAEAGLIGGQPLSVQFSDYQGTAFDVGYRYLFATGARRRPFVSMAVGFQRLQDITLSLSSTPYTSSNIPFYDDSWVFGWRVGGGILADINDRLGWQVTVDIKYAGGISDQSGIGTVGFERINDAGNRWSVPILAGVYVKF